MTQEEAIKIFRKEIECLSHTKCEDCILEKACDPMKTTPYDSEYIEAYSMAIKALEQEPKKGYWISHREHCEMNNLLPSGLGSYCWCSECDCGIDSKHFHRVYYNYCPNCGAKMESEDK